MSRSLAQQSGLLTDFQNEKAALVAQLSANKVVSPSPEVRVFWNHIDIIWLTVIVRNSRNPVSDHYAPRLSHTLL